MITMPLKRQSSAIDGGGGQCWPDILNGLAGQLEVERVGAELGVVGPGDGVVLGDPDRLEDARLVPDLEDALADPIGRDRRAPPPRRRTPARYGSRRVARRALVGCPSAPPALSVAPAPRPRHTRAPATPAPSAPPPRKRDSPYPRKRDPSYPRLPRVSRGVLDGLPARPPCAGRGGGKGLGAHHIEIPAPTLPPYPRKEIRHTRAKRSVIPALAAGICGVLHRVPRSLPARGRGAGRGVVRTTSRYPRSSIVIPAQRDPSYPRLPRVSRGVLDGVRAASLCGAGEVGTGLARTTSRYPRPHLAIPAQRDPLYPRLPRVSRGVLHRVPRGQPTRAGEVGRGVGAHHIEIPALHLVIPAQRDPSYPRLPRVSRGVLDGLPRGLPARGQGRREQAWCAPRRDTRGKRGYDGGEGARA